MTRFFTADSHFSLQDNDVVFRDFRPFATVIEMNDKIVELWNAQAKSDDVIYHLGDFVNYNWTDNVYFDECFKFVQKLNAKVILICGNNEEKIIHHEYNDNFDAFKKHLLEIGFFDVVCDGIDIEIGGIPFYLTHRPSKHKPNQENLFGHIHSTGFVKKYGFNIGIDNHYLSMFSEQDILKLLDSRKYFDEEVYD